jgi:hypothetical protein
VPCPYASEKPIVLGSVVSFQLRPRSVRPPGRRARKRSHLGVRPAVELGPKGVELESEPGTTGDIVRTGSGSEHLDEAAVFGALEDLERTCLWID